MSSIIARVTRGRIRKGTSKVSLVLAVFGSMYFGVQEPIPNPTDPIPIIKKGGTNKNNFFKEVHKEARIRQIKIEDSEIIAIVKQCLKITII